MKIYYVNLPYLFAVSRTSRWPEKAKSGTLYYPYRLCFGAGVAQQKGFQVSVIDCIAQKMDAQALLALLRQERPDYLVCEITTPTYSLDYQTLTFPGFHTAALTAQFCIIQIVPGLRI